MTGRGGFAVDLDPTLYLWHDEGMTTEQHERDTRYLTAVSSTLLLNSPKVAPWLTDTCPECDRSVAGMDALFGDHIVLTGAVIIACEGYWVINPEAVGLDRGNWDDWRFTYCEGCELDFRKELLDADNYCPQCSAQRPKEDG